MELMDVGLWGMCMALCVWVGAAMALVGPPQQPQQGGAGAELRIAPGRHEFFI